MRTTRMREDFAALILSHGRPRDVMTMQFLRSGGYTGKAYIVIDDEDPTADEYREEHGEDTVIQFCKAEAAATFDLMDNRGDRRTVAFARNASWGIARSLGLRYFIQLDDDYFNFSYRTTGKRDGETDSYHQWTIRSLDAVFTALVDFLDESQALTVCFSQGGDHVGGIQSANRDTRLLRKAMNSFVCDVDRPFAFPGRINEDVNAYVGHGARGALLFTHTDLQLQQVASQKTGGGMTGLYLDGGTYLKSMYTVMQNPSCVQVRTIGDTSRRLHHHVSWRHAVPRIVPERLRRG